MIEERNRWTQLTVGGRFPAQQVLISIFELNVPRQNLSAADEGSASRRAGKDIPLKAHLVCGEGRAKRRIGNHFEREVWQQPVQSQFVLARTQQIIHDDPRVFGDALDRPPMFYSEAPVAVVLALKMVRK